MLVAAAESAGHTELIAAAAGRLGLSPDYAADAERAGLVTLRIFAFRHPLVRSAVYGAALGIERRQVHAALVARPSAWPGGTRGVACRGGHVRRRHRCRRPARGGADRAAKRGGDVAARLLARAADLTPAGPDRDDRLLAAAEAAGEAGAAHLSRDLLDRIDPDDLDQIQQGRRIMGHTQVAMPIADPAAVMSSPADMLRAADEFHGLDPKREQRALLRAFELALVTESLMEGTTLPELGHRLEAGAKVMDGPYAIVLRAVAAHILRPYTDAIPFMREAIATLSVLDDGDLPKFGFVAIALTTALFDEQAGANYLSRLARIARDAGSLRALDTALWVRSIFELGRGDPAAGGRYVEQVRELRRAIGYEAENVVNVSYLAWTGVPETRSS